MKDPAQALKQKVKIMPERKAIGFHFVHMTADLATSGTLLPDLIRCTEEQEVKKMARKTVQEASDPYEIAVACLRVYNDGTVILCEYSISELLDE
jgi:hypothetical protein